jgi:ferric-dicitrate binding protein FerR (iron transport regulator)
MTHPHDDLQRNDLQCNDLQWTAYRYSAGELSADDSLRFEDRLATDQVAREALASAVALSETVCAIERDGAASRVAVMPAETVRRSWRQPAGWVAVAAAACLALTFVWRGPAGNEDNGLQPQPETAAKVEPVDAEAALLLALLEDGSDEEGSILVPSLHSEPTHDEAVELALDAMLRGSDQYAAEGDEADLDDQNATPDWILAAVMESKS